MTQETRPDVRVWRVTAPHYVAGMTIADGVSVKPCAPILGWTLGKSAAYLRSYFKQKRHTVEVANV